MGVTCSTQTINVTNFESGIRSRRSSRNSPFVVSSLLSIPVFTNKTSLPKKEVCVALGPTVLKFEGLNTRIRHARGIYTFDEFWQAGCQEFNQKLADLTAAYTGLLEVRPPFARKQRIYRGRLRVAEVEFALQTLQNRLRQVYMSLQHRPLIRYRKGVARMTRQLESEVGQFKAVINAHYDELTFGRRIDHTNAPTHLDFEQPAPASPGKYRKSPSLAPANASPAQRPGLPARLSTPPEAVAPASPGLRPKRSPRIRKPISLRQMSAEFRARWIERSEAGCTHASGTHIVMWSRRSPSQKPSMPGRLKTPEETEAPATVEPKARCEPVQKDTAPQAPKPTTAAAPCSPRVRQRLSLRRDMTPEFRARWIERSEGVGTTKKGVHIVIWRKNSTRLTASPSNFAMDSGYEAEPCALDLDGHSSASEDGCDDSKRYGFQPTKVSEPALNNCGFEGTILDVLRGRVSSESSKRYPRFTTSAYTSEADAELTDDAQTSDQHQTDEEQNGRRKRMHERGPSMSFWDASGELDVPALAI